MGGRTACGACHRGASTTAVAKPAPPTITPHRVSPPVLAYAPKTPDRLNAYFVTAAAFLSLIVLLAITSSGPSRPSAPSPAAVNWQPLPLSATAPRATGNYAPPAGGSSTYYSPPTSDIHVNGYVRSNGTYVEPHYRTQRDGIFGNNYSTKGNYNPHTGRYGTRTHR